jgi:cell division protein FtsX
MKIALLAVLGAVLGALGGAAIGIIAGIGWVEVFKNVNAEATLVFFIFMPMGAMFGMAVGAILFGAMAARDAKIPIARESGRRRDS